MVLRFVGIFCMFSLAWGCASSSKITITPEPVLDQIIAETEEVCLKFKLWGGGYPCIRLRGEKDNSTGKTQYSFRYEVGTFDVDLPLGVSLKLGDTWFNLTKLGTDYSSTIVYSSRLAPEVLPIFKKASGMSVSYTTRKKTENIEFSTKERELLQSQLEKLVQTLESEPKIKIEKK